MDDHSWPDLMRTVQPKVQARQQIDEVVADPWPGYYQRQHGEPAQHVSQLKKSDESTASPNNAWLDETLNDLSSAPVAQQVAIGAFSGWCSGFLIGRIGKVAAVATCGSLLLLTVAHNQGLIHINWNQVKQRVQSTQNKLNQQYTQRHFSAIVNYVWQIGRRHVFITGSFGAGFLIGLIM